MRITEKQLRRLIHEILEGRAEFHDDVKGINFNLQFNDPLFQSPENKSHKKTARDIKRSWNRNVGKVGDPNRDWIQSLTKVHWIYGFQHNLVQKINRTLGSDKRGEISAVMYEPGKPITMLKDWGNLGLRVDGWVSLASLSMDTLLSGYIGDAVPTDPTAKKPRYPTHFSRHSPGTYVMGPNDYLFDKHRSNKNEAFVGNWKPIEWVIGPGFFVQVGGFDDTQAAQATLDRIKSTGLPAKDLDGNTLELDLESLEDYMMRSTKEL
jgi:hypothetical protein